MWFSDPGTTRAVGMINPTTHAISEFSLPASSMPLGIAAGPDGNVWFTDSGTTKAIGMINPTTHAISEFPVRLPGSNLQQGRWRARTATSGSPTRAPPGRSG